MPSASALYLSPQAALEVESAREEMGNTPQRHQGLTALETCTQAPAISLLSLGTVKWHLSREKRQPSTPARQHLACSLSDLGQNTTLVGVKSPKLIRLGNNQVLRTGCSWVEGVLAMSEDTEAACDLMAHLPHSPGHQGPDNKQSFLRETLA